MLLNIILIILLIAVLSWREVQILIDRLDWDAEDYRGLFWYTEWASKWKDFDSFHISNGLATVLILLIGASKSYVSLTGLIIPSLADVQPIGIALDIIIYWLIWMHVRNIFMHIIFKRKPEWRYLLPQIIYKLWR